MKEKKEKPRVGRILDLLLILFLVLGVACGAVRYWGSGDTAAQDDTLPYTAVLDSGEIDPAIADCLLVGDALYRADGTLLGRVMRTERRAAEVCLFENGEARRATWDEGVKCRMLVWVAITGRESDGGFLERGRAPMGVGERIVLYSERSVLTYRVSAIEKSAL